MVLGSGLEGVIDLTKRGTVVYGREGQRVWREVVKFSFLAS